MHVLIRVHENVTPEKIENDDCYKSLIVIWIMSEHNSLGRQKSAIVILVKQ
jgi:hypothetical protein